MHECSLSSADMPAKINTAALISSGVTFLLTFTFTLIVGCTCGICFVIKCKKSISKADATPSLHPMHMPVYESVQCHDIVLSKDMEQTVAVELKQNVSYAQISMS